MCGRIGIGIKRVPGDHAGGKWRLSYTSVSGRGGTLEVDVNFLLRTPLWPSVTQDSRSVGSFRVTKVPVLDIHELAAGKLAALFGRAASRDIFDVHELLRATKFEPERLRLAFVVYGGMNRRDWRAVSLEEVRVDPRDVDRQLVPLLRRGLAPTRPNLNAWSERLTDECRDRLSQVLPLRASEVEFLDHLNVRGEIVPELLTSDRSMQQLLRSHPGLHWKAFNVRKQYGLGGESDRGS